MKWVSYVSRWSLFVLALALWTLSHAGTIRRIEIGRFWDLIQDACHSAQPEGQFGLYYTSDFVENSVNNSSVHWAATNWTDVDGTTYDVWVAGAGHVGPNETNNVMPLEDANGITIKKYWRYQPPTIFVDGFQLHPPLLDGEEVNPSVIPGTAEVMVESTVNTMLGLTIHQKVLAWSQKNHDDYHIYDWVMTNTGNLDFDEEIEKEQTLTDLYMTKEQQYSHTWRTVDWWSSAYGEFPGDSLRMTYLYPARNSAHAEDRLGQVNLNTGYIERGWSVGEGILFASESPDNYATDNPLQPVMTDVNDQDLTWDKPDARDLASTSDSDTKARATLYTAMSKGFLDIDGSPRYTEEDGVPAGTFHGVRTDEKSLKFPNELPWFTARHVNFQSVGPYTLAPGDSIRVVWARAMGSISPAKLLEVGQAWLAGTAADLWEGPYKLPPPHAVYPDLSPTDNDKAKDSWVYSGKDSLFQNMWNAQWNFNSGFNAPVAPPPPSIEVTSFPERINISWGSESESASDFAGYRVYRARGNPGPILDPNTGQLIGLWELIHDSPGAGSHSYDDTGAAVGQNYYYAVSAYDDGSQNGIDVIDTQGNPIHENESLESGLYLTRTTQPASLLTASAPDLGSIRVVPNPYNINGFTYDGAQNKISFQNLPGYCTIRIYTESGDLIKTLEHDDGSGTQDWGDLSEEYSATDTGQIIVSGLYIAHVIEKREDGTQTGNSKNVKFVVVR